MLQRQGFLWMSEGRWCWYEPNPGLSHPVTLEGVVSQTLQPVWASRPQAETLLALGLSGSLDDRAALARALGYAPEELEQHMRALEGLGLLREGQPFHPLLVEVAVREDPALAQPVARRLLLQLRGLPRLCWRRPASSRRRRCSGWSAGWRVCRRWPPWRGSSRMPPHC